MCDVELLVIVTAVLANIGISFAFSIINANKHLYLGQQHSPYFIKYVLHFSHFHSCHAKWMKCEATLVKTLNEIWLQSLNDFLNLSFQSWQNFIPIRLVHECNLLLCMNIADVIKIYGRKLRLFIIS